MIVGTTTISTKTTPNPPPQAKVEMANGRSGKEKAADIQKNLQLNKNVDLDFSVNQGSGDIVITVRDESTGKVIREIPLEEMRNVDSRIDSMAGLILDRKV